MNTQMAPVTEKTGVRARLCRPRPRAAVQTGQGASANSPSSLQEREMKVTARGHLAALLFRVSEELTERKKQEKGQALKEQLGSKRSWAGRADQEGGGMGVGVFLSFFWGFLIWCL